MTALALAGLGIGTSLAISASSCSDAGASDAGSSSSGGFITDAADDGAHFCGNEFHQPIVKRPLLYFVIDTSGSMSTPFDGTTSRFDVLHQASARLVNSLGPLIRVGAAVFPYAPTNANTCATGKQVFAPKAGDADGVVAQEFAQATAFFPSGGTPTAATLKALAPKFQNAATDSKGPEAVLLVTDGGPNCDSSMTCDVDECIPNLDGDCPGSVGNCCAPPKGDGGNCIDRGPTLEAIHDVAALGAKVYVIGLAVGKPYESTLSQMAIAGGAPQPYAPYYYPSDDLAALDGAFKQIAADLISCEIGLADPPTDMGLTNVYLDGTELVQDPTNGWIWEGSDKIVLVGGACEALKTGKVKDVQVVTGCPTEVPK